MKQSTQAVSPTNEGFLVIARCSRCSREGKIYCRNCQSIDKFINISVTEGTECLCGEKINKMACQCGTNIYPKGFRRGEETASQEAESSRANLQVSLIRKNERADWLVSLALFAFGWACLANNLTIIGIVTFGISLFCSPYYEWYLRAKHHVPRLAFQVGRYAICISWVWLVSQIDKKTNSNTSIKTHSSAVIAETASSDAPKNEEGRKYCLGILRKLIRLQGDLEIARFASQYQKPVHQRMVELGDGCGQLSLAFGILRKPYEGNGISASEVDYAARKISEAKALLE